MTPSPAEISDWLVARVSVLTDAAPAEVDVRAPLMYHGFDSVTLITLTADLESWLGYRFRRDPFEAHPTIEALSRFLAEQSIRRIVDEPPYDEWLRPAAEIAPVRIPDCLLIVLQLALILAIVHRFELAGRNHLFPILCLATSGFLIHTWLPSRMRLPFFVLLSLGGIFLYLGWPNGAWVIGVGSGLIAICYLPIPLVLRVTLIGLVALALTMARVQYEGPFWPVLGSMFMFRMIIYLFEQRRVGGQPPLALTLAYFFPLPNVGFPFFPILDFRTFRDTYRPDAPWATAQTGIAWIVRGLSHLLVYRIIKYYLLPPPEDLNDLPHVALFLATNYALYLHVSGIFHIITGVFHLFGFELPRTHLNYFLASSFTDIWWRINIYWKDFMSKVFFFPAYFATRALGTRIALAFAALGVFLATWLLHAYQAFWITGGFPLTLYDAALWLGVGVLVTVNLQIKLARSKKTSQSSKSGLSSVLDPLLLSLRVVGMFVLISIFWAFWNTPFILKYLRVMPRADLAGIALVLGVLLAAVAVGVIAQLVRDRLKRFELWPLQISPSASAFGLTAALVALLIIGMPSVSSVFGSYPAAVIASLRRESATPAEAALAVQGYYEEITDVPVTIGPLLAALEGRPPPARHTNYPEMTRSSDIWMTRELIPDWSGEIAGGKIKVNRLGMRDRDRTREKPPGGCRLAVVGSSVVMGYGVDDDQVFTRLLEDQLTAGGHRCEVLNFGEGLTDVLHRRVQIDRKVFAFAPDAIYYVAHQNELTAPIQQVANLVAKGEPLRYGLGDVVRDGGITPVMDRSAMEARLDPLARQLIHTMYRDLVAECRHRGVLLVWVYLPMPGITSTPVQSTEIIDAARDGGFTTVDLSDWSENHEPAEVMVGGTEYHPNALGHRLIAERLDALLRQRPELIPACARARE